MKHYQICETDARRLAEALRYIETQRANAHRHLRRVRGTPPGGGGRPIRKAFCSENAGSGNTIAAYLDIDELNEAEDNDITVTCTLIGSSNLNECFPTLSTGVMMSVWWDAADELWRSLWWFQAHEECPEEEEG